ncbi:uncharacterized protein LOC128959844 [Oppia nitens]|uniref:uncharacterized protein LOC128959844 n=1 Tax=Oppia nitens TaxID=1686743 RepID=UPI0023DACD66|nr:uncharacterized protein LOC128959844 [Oppia nitens]
MSTVYADNQFGLIVTNNHVTQANDTLVVDLINNETLRYCDVFIGEENQEIIYRMFGRVVYTAPDHELALIQLLPIRSNVLPVCKFTTDCQPGDPIVVISSKGGQSFIADGLIQIIDKRQNLIKCYKNANYINDLGDTTDVLIHTGFIVGGYSGGPVIDMSGQVVGVHKGSVRGYSYFSAAIGAKTVMDFIEKGKQYLLTENVEVMKGLARKHRRLMKRKILGLVLVNNQIVDYTFTSYLTRQHLLITDYIIAYNNIPFTTPEAMSYYVQQLPDNTPPIVVTVYRSNYNQYFTVNTQPITVEQFHC